MIYLRLETLKYITQKKKIDDIVLSNTSYLIGKNIFFINKKFILQSLSKLNFIENISVEKKYPSTIYIKTKATNLIGITYIDQKKYFVGQNRNFILAKNISNEKKLPIIFGKFNVDDYIFLQKELINHKINLNEIIRYYFHKNKRWDLYFKNNVIIQLPNKNVSEAIKLFKEFELNNKIASNTIIDLRIQNRLILRNE